MSELAELTPRSELLKRDLCDDSADIGVLSEATTPYTTESTAESAICEFHRLIPNAPRPRRADRSADGTLPVAAYRHCEAAASASAYGWYVFPPTTFSLWWIEGDEIAFNIGGGEKWSTLQGAHYPGFRNTFAAMAPPGFAELAPSMLVQGLMPGVVQVWSGYFVRTAPGWSLLSRRTANIQRPQPYDNFEGLLETDEWFEPLFTNVQLKRIGSPVEFHVTKPLFQVQPVWRPSYGDPSFELREAAEWTAGDWAQFEAMTRRNTNDTRAKGHYGALTRKRQRRCPVG